MQVRGITGRLLLLTTALVTAVAWAEPGNAATPRSGRTADKSQPMPGSHNQGLGNQGLGQVSKLRVPPTMVRYKASAHPVSGRMVFSGTPTTRSKLLKGGKMRYAVDNGISCVPFARAATGIDLKGNATNWWDAADGVYERGSRPEPGSVLNFRSTGRMRLGHVAAVVAVVNSREVEIDHANWAGPGNAKGRVARGISVVDVSDDNDWSAVRVELGRTGEYGSVYPTYGFIYDRPDRGVMVANNLPGRGHAPRVAAYEEVAEAPARSGVREAAYIDAPTRGVR
jgi:surface antigen